MSCHTWFYKKVNPQPTREDKINQFIEQYGEWCKKIENALANNGFDYEDDDDKWFPFVSKDDAKKELERYKWMMNNAHYYEDYSNIKSDDDKTLSKEEQLCYDIENWQALLNKDSIVFGCENMKYDTLTICINGIYYSHVNKYHDTFRYYNYDTYVLSEDEMWKLIENNYIVISDDAKKNLKEFWPLYPDGVIYFG